MFRLFKIIFWLGLASFLVGSAGLVYVYTQNQSINYKTEKLTKHEVIDAKAAKEISITTMTADIELLESATDQIEVSVSGDVSKRAKASYDLVTNTTEDGRVQIRLNEPSAFLFNFGFMEGVTVTVKLPQKQYQAISLESHTGNLHVAGMNSVELELSTDTGNETVNGYKGKVLKTDSSTGNAKLTDIEAKTTIQTNTGNVKMTAAALADDIAITTDTGNVELVLPDELAALSLELDSSVGNVSTNLKQPISFTKHGDNQVKGKIGTAGPDVKISTSTGNIKVRNNH